MYPTYDNSYKALDAGVKPNEFWFDFQGNLRKMAEEPGKYLTRGDYGDSIYSYYCMIWGYSDDYPGGYWRNMKQEDVENTLPIEINLMGWDSDYGYLG